MVLLSNVCQVKACFGPFGDSVSLGTRYLYSLRQMYHWLKIILDAPDGTPR
jgi:hypothetical protein